MKILSLSIVTFCIIFMFLITISSSSPLQRVTRIMEKLKQKLDFLYLQGYVQEGDFGVRNKKPFCNAFTGCGRKRADPEMAEEELLGLLAERIQGIRDQVRF